MVSWLDGESEAAIESFWKNVEVYKNVYPRPLQDLVPVALPVSLVLLPKLDIEGVLQWFIRRNTLLNMSYPNRRLHGCLVAFRDRGIIFVDSLDSKVEQRFTIAHEVAHFILDYQNPRALAVSVFGETIISVLMGERLPTPSEILAATIQQIPITLSVQLMERNDHLGYVVYSVRDVEDRADRLALALLAPPGNVLDETPLDAPNFVQRHNTLTLHLEDKYGLPNGLARLYSYSLLEENGYGPSWVENLHFR